MLLLYFINSISLVLLLSSTVGQRDYCSFDVQQDLQYGVSNEWTDSCCTNTSHSISNYIKTIGLFQQLNATQITTLYDSTCGLALFEAPVGRTFQEWKTECEAYGMLRFREDEIVWDNVELLKTGELVSICGTHLGDYSSISVSPYSVHIACISGRPINGITTDTVLNGSAYNPGSLLDPGSATWLLGIIILGSLGGILFLLSTVSCYKCWEKRRAQKWRNDRGPMKLLFLEEEHNQECLEPEYTVSIPPRTVYRREEVERNGVSSSDQYRECPWNGITEVDEYEKDVYCQESMNCEGDDLGTNCPA